MTNPFKPHRRDTPGTRLPPADAWRKCEFCGCETNARMRACCERGKYADKKKGHQ